MTTVDNSLAGVENWVEVGRVQGHADRYHDEVREVAVWARAGELSIGITYASGYVYGARLDLDTAALLPSAIAKALVIAGRSAQS